MCDTMRDSHIARAANLARRTTIHDRMGSSCTLSEISSFRREAADPLTDAISWYDARAEQLADRYETVPAERIHHWLKDLLPSKTGTVLDVGAGSGRDAAWLASQGFDVVAVEPSSGMRAAARKRYADSADPMDHRLSAGARTCTFRTGLSFDVILLSAVWMHVAPSDRTRAFRKLITLLKPGGLLAVTLRHGPTEPERGFHPVSEDEVRRLARNHGAFIERHGSADDHLGRSDVRWSHLAIRLPDDGTGALPLLAAHHPQRRQELHLQAGPAAYAVSYRRRRRRRRSVRG